MLARATFAISPVLLFACVGNYPEPASCAADDVCIKPAAHSGGLCCDAATEERADDNAKASNAARTQATRAAKDGGGLTDLDASSPTRNDAGASGSKDRSASKPKAEQIPPIKKQPATSDSGVDVANGSATATCEGSCGECEVCSTNGEMCEPVTGRDDADSCGDTRSCSSKGECLYVREAQTELGKTIEWAELTQAYAQIVTFAEPTTIQEIRLEVSCADSDELFPPAWIAAASGGIPTSTIVAAANIVYQSPAETNSFAMLELSKALDEPAGASIAIVVGKTDMSCVIRVNKQAMYAHGELFAQNEQGEWTANKGSMVFQVLSSK